VIFDVAPGGAGERQSMERFRAAMPDVRFRVVDQVAEGDMVATRLHVTGQPIAPYGQELTPGTPFDTNALALFRLEGGRVREEWYFVDAGRRPD
jgi:predicted ester cyclase